MNYPIFVTVLSFVLLSTKLMKLIGLKHDSATVVMIL